MLIDKDGTPIYPPYTTEQVNELNGQISAAAAVMETKVVDQAQYGNSGCTMIMFPLAGCTCDCCWGRCKH